jgi:DNA-binding Lrp family transcriptional regulator
MSRVSTPASGPPRQVDESDRRLLALLRADGRLPVSELASRANLSRANAYARLERLRTAGVITGFTVLLDPDALGAGLPAFIHVRIRQHSWKSFRDGILDVAEVEHVALVSGEFDVVLFVRTRDVKTLRALVLERLQTMPEVIATQTSFILDEARRP